MIMSEVTSTNIYTFNRDLNEMERIHDMAAHSPEDFLANPINAYLLVKKLTVDWADLQDVMTDNSMGKGSHK